MIDLSNLDITTPLKKPNGSTAWTLSGDEIFSKAPSFVYRTDNGIMFRAPTYGAATSSVHRTRCEWKESNPWKLESQDFHCNTQEFTLHEINTASSVVVSQTHDHHSNSPLCKVFVQKNKSKVLSILAGVRTKRVKTDPAKEEVFVDFKIGEAVSITQAIDAKNMTLTITVIQGDRSERKVWPLDEAWKETELVFHGGVYNQLDMGSSDDGTGSKLELSLLELKHFSDVKADLYAITEKQLDEIKAEYLQNLKLLQTSAKVKLNQLTTDMKQLTDKEKTAPIYLEIRAFKDAMENSLKIDG